METPVRRERSERYVTIMQDGLLTRKRVQAGWTQDGWTEITDGLTEGEIIVLPER